MDAVATVNVLTTINKFNDVKLEKTRQKSSTRFEIIDKLDRDYSYRQFLSLVFPLKYHVTCTIMQIVFLPSPTAPPPQKKQLHKHCLQFLLGITVIPREIEDNGHKKFWGVKKTHYGLGEKSKV